MTASEDAGSRQEHWAAVWGRKDPTQVSWYEDQAETSLNLIHACTADPAQGILDVGGGASRLVDGLLAAGHGDVSVLDISEAALAHAQRRLGPPADAVHWFTADITAWSPPRRWHIWHDRAVFHFLTNPADVAAYRDVLTAALEPGGWAVIGTFGPRGPRKCSGLEVQGYGADELAAALGPTFHLRDSHLHVHTTPQAVEQEFHWGIVQRG
jgi:SAM-dependent methyltransferase